MLTRSLIIRIAMVAIALFMVIPILLLVELEFIQTGFFRVVSDYPILSSLLYIPALLPFIASSGQMRRYNFTADIAHGDFSGGASVFSNHFHADLEGWVQKVTFTTVNDIDFTTPVVMVATVMTDFTDSVVVSSAVNPAIAITTPFKTTKDAATLVLEHRPHILMFGPGTDNEIQVGEITTMSYLKVGDELGIEVAMADIQVAPSAGNVILYVTVYFIVSTLKHGNSDTINKRSQYLVFVGTGAPGVDNIWTYLANVDQRLYAINMTIYNNAGFGDQDSVLIFHTGDAPATHWMDDASDGVAFPERDDFLVLSPTADVPWISTEGETNITAVSKFVKGPVFQRKSQPWNLRFHNSNPTVDNWFSIIAQLFPDYQNAVDFSVKFAFDETSDEETEHFKLPYDVYITQIETEVYGNMPAAADLIMNSFVDIIGIKRGNHFFEGSDEETGFLNTPGTTANVETIDHPGLLDRIIVYVGEADATASQVFQRSSLEMVNDYYEQGSHIVVSVTGATPSSEYEVHLKIEGIYPKKEGKNEVLSFYHRGDNLGRIVNGRLVTGLN